MSKSRDLNVLRVVIRGLLFSASFGWFCSLGSLESRADSLRPWGGAVLEAKGFSGSSEKKEGPDQSISLNSAMRYDWYDDGGSGRDMKSPYSVEYLARSSSDSSKMLTIKDSFRLPGRNGGTYRYNPDPLDDTRGQDTDSTYATAQWNGDSVRIKNPAGQSVPDRVRLVFELGIAASRYDHFRGGESGFGQASVTVNGKSMTMSDTLELQIVEPNGYVGPISYDYRYSNGIAPGARFTAVPGTSLANLIEGDFSYPTSAGENLRDFVKTAYDQSGPYLYGRFTVDLDVDQAGSSEQFSAELLTRAGFGFDGRSERSMSKSITLGLVDVTTIDGESLESLGYELDFASGLVLTQPTVVPEPSSIAIASVLIVAGLIARKRQNRETRSAS